MIFYLLKKLISIFLLFCLIAPITGTYIWLKYEKKQTKREVKRLIIAGMDKKELVLLKFAKSETKTKLNWKHSKEFEYKGQMYDVVETEVSGDSISYRCWWDNDETKLNRKLTNLVSDALGNNPLNKENNKRLIDFFKSLYHGNPSDCQMPYQIVINSFFNNNSEAYNSFSSVPLVPPPRFV